MEDQPTPDMTTDQFAEMSPEEFHQHLARVTQKVHESLNGEIIDLAFLAVLNVIGAFYSMAETPERRAHVLSIIQNAIDALPELVEQTSKYGHLYPVPNPTDLH